MIRPRNLVLVLVVLPGCFFWQASVDPSYRPTGARALKAAGIYELTYAVEVEDERPEPDGRLVGERAGVVGSDVRAARTADEIVTEAISNELEVRDLRVVSRSEADVLFDVRLEEFYVNGQSSNLIGPEGGEANAYAEGVIRVVDPRSPAVAREIPISVRVKHRSMLLTARKYEWALNDVLAQFSRRVVRHPDVLIAVQTVGGILPGVSGADGEGTR